MKADIHPNYVAMSVTCSCGNAFETRSTLGDALHVDVCSSCHPFYTGKQKMLDTGGRVDKFRKRFGSRRAVAAPTE
ncbi:50S ribosomal protein L31 [Zhongshania aliphaticivorans]|uniref:50S ribosomal protein L31 n=1 Tax=Zhongshania aliphaticivorans TaxID=1470434 RepID=UPI0039C97E36